LHSSPKPTQKWDIQRESASGGVYALGLSPPSQILMKIKKPYLFILNSDFKNSCRFGFYGEIPIGCAL